MINHAANSSIGERDWVAADKLITGNVFHTGMCVYVCFRRLQTHTQGQILLSYLSQHYSHHMYKCLWPQP